MEQLLLVLFGQVCWCRGFTSAADDKLTICLCVALPARVRPPNHLQHYAQCELLPRDDEIADKTLAGQFAGAVSHQ